MRLLVDTNVFLDLALRRGEKFNEAVRFFSWCVLHSNQTYVTSMTLRDVEYVTHRHFHDKDMANAALSEAYKLCSKVIGISADSAINALFEDYKDYEDELIIQAAKEEMLDAIVTNNVKDFQNRGIPVFTPTEIIKAVTFVNV